LYRNNIFYLTICSQTPAGQTSYTWILPYTLSPGGQFKVKVTSLSSPVPVFDFSDGYFSIDMGTIQVSSPNGGENWMKGTTHPILWTDNLCDNVRIELWKGGVFSMLIAALVPSSGSYNWAIPNSATLVPGNDYRVKILGVGANTATTNNPFDFSDNNFTISPGQNNTPVTVVTPNGGETWIIGCPALIQWVTPSAVWSPVKLELFRNDLYYMTICNLVPTGQSSFSWIPPWSVIPGDAFKVKVTLLGNTAGTGGVDFSDNNFSIHQGSIMVTSPNGGEQWAKGTVHPIRWFDNLCEKVRIELWKGSAFHSVIAFSVPSSGVYNWILPNITTLVPGSDYRVRIAAMANATTATNAVYDFSDSYFSILAASAITVTGLSDLRLYPNPFSDRLTIELPAMTASRVVIELADDHGLIVLSREAGGKGERDALNLNTAALPEGWYVIRVRMEGRVLFSRNVLLRR